ncbi:MAG TPA: hypothetical protein VE869_01065 [Gemmatimonas sp.]|nr:hypothetical protein [Gemmatimonas sp.]
MPWSIRNARVRVRVRVRRTIQLHLISLCLPLGVVVAQERQVHEPTGPLPSAAHVFAAHAAAVGPLEGRTSLLLRGTITGAGVPDGSRFERYLDRAGRYLHVIRSGTTIVSAEGWSGDTAFRIVNGQRLRMTPGTVAAIREHAIAFAGVHPSVIAAGATTIEWSDFNDRWHAKVLVTLRPGDARHELYDLETGLLAASIRDRGTDADGRKYARMFVWKTYRAFDGAKIPTVITELDGKSEWRMRVDSVQWNAPAPALDGRVQP